MRANGESARQRVSPRPGRPADTCRHFPCPRAARRRALGRDCGDADKEIVEIVRQAAGELAHGFYRLALPQRVLRLPELSFEWACRQGRGRCGRLGRSRAQARIQLCYPSRLIGGSNSDIWRPWRQPRPFFFVQVVLDRRPLTHGRQLSGAPCRSRCVADGAIDGQQ